MVRIIRVLGEYHIVPSALLMSLHFLLGFIGELMDQFQRPLVVMYSDKADSPLEDYHKLEQKLDNKTRIQQHLKLTQSGL